MFLQFLVFSRGLDFQIEDLGSTPYRQVVFQVNDFLTFQNPTVKSTNYSQLKKLLNFFEELQTNFLLTSFNNEEFQSLVLIPKVKLIKLQKS